MIELLNIDCMDYVATLESGSVDLLIQDTPFGVTQNKWDIKPDLKTMWPEWVRITKHNAAMIFFATQPFASELILSNIKLFRYDLIWEKSQSTGFLNAKKMPLRSHEIILVFYRNLPTFNPQIFDKPLRNIRPRGTGKGKASTNYGSYKLNGFDVLPQDKSCPGSILFFENEQGNVHPTQKPIDLIRYLIKTYSNKNDLVFDGYSGSATTAAACHLENRNAICCEIDKDYYEAGVKRYNEAIKQQTLFSYDPDSFRL